MPFCVVAPEDQNEERKAALDRLHFEKIDMAHHILVVANQNRCVGESTRREIDYATAQGKFGESCWREAC